MFQGKEAWYLYAAPCDSPCPFWQQPSIPLAVGRSWNRIEHVLHADRLETGCTTADSRSRIIRTDSVGTPEQQIHLLGVIATSRRRVLFGYNQQGTPNAVMRRQCAHHQGSRFPCYFLHRQRLDVTDEQSRQSDQHIHGRWISDHPVARHWHFHRNRPEAQCRYHSRRSGLQPSGQGLWREKCQHPESLLRNAGLRYDRKWEDRQRHRELAWGEERSARILFTPSRWQ